VSQPRIRDAGDSAVLLEWEPVIDASLNARAVATADALRAAAVAGVRDVIATFRSVAVYVDPLTVDRAALSAALKRATAACASIGPAGSVRTGTEPGATGPSSPAPVARRSTVEVPVVYGGAHGPDLEVVANWAGLSAADVVARHAGAVYRVFMLGFMPGFAYMGLVDEQIAAPRLSTPRVHVPAGSVGIAGRQTGVYPRQSPGGWRLIGRTAARVFDPARSPASLFRQGDDVRFVPVPEGAARWDRVAAVDAGVWESSGGAGAGSGALHGAARSEGRRELTVLRTGPHLTVQDAGRWGHQRDGVSPCGAMDPVSYRIANAVVGNEPGAATLEVTLGGPELRLESPAVVGLAGGDLGATIDGQSVTLGAPIACRAGSVLRFGGRPTDAAGARAYVAFDGGIDTPCVLGSRATHARSGLGGVAGRALCVGDRVPLGPRTAVGLGTGLGAGVRTGTWRGGHSPHLFGAPVPLPCGGARVRVMLGPHDDWFAPDAVDVLRATRFTVSSASDRMGYRLTGGRPLQRRDGDEMISDATFIGALQVPPSGDPILLMADRPVTGGYPQVATVITADLPLVGQLSPGHWIEFEMCSRDDAVAALVAQEAGLRALG
jgi:KipI family sensor histidine kinase inhibitor